MTTLSTDFSYMPPDKSAYLNYSSYYSTKIYMYVVGTQKTVSMRRLFGVHKTHFFQLIDEISINYMLKRSFFGLLSYERVGN